MVLAELRVRGTDQTMRGRFTNWGWHTVCQQYSQGLLLLDPTTKTNQAGPQQNQGWSAFEHLQTLHLQFLTRCKAQMRLKWSIALLLLVANAQGCNAFAKGLVISNFTALRAFLFYGQAHFVYRCTQGFIALCRFPQTFGLDEKVLGTAPLDRVWGYMCVNTVNTHLTKVFEWLSPNFVESVFQFVMKVGSYYTRPFMRWHSTMLNIQIRGRHWIGLIVQLLFI